MEKRKEKYVKMCFEVERKLQEALREYVAAGNMTLKQTMNCLIDQFLAKKKNKKGE